MSANRFGNNYRPGNQRFSNQRQGNYRQYNNYGSNQAGNSSYGGYGSYDGQNRYGNSSSYKSTPPNKEKGNPNQTRYQPNRNQYLNFYNGPGNYSSESNNNQIWMGDLEPTWNEETISKIWTSLGQTPVSVKIMRDRSGDPNRMNKPTYCFVNFENQEAVSSAIAKNGLQVPGHDKTLRLNWASASNNSSTLASSTSSPSSNAQGSIRGPSARSQMEFSLFIGDLGLEVTDSILFKAFESLYPGQIKQAKVMVNPMTKMSKGFGFVRFNNEITHKKALANCTGMMIGSRPIRVAPAAPVSSSTSTNVKNTQKIETKSNQVNFAQSQPPLTPSTDPRNTTICIKELSSNISESDLVSHFITFGHIIYCKIIPHLNRGYIMFYTREAAETSILFMNGFMINDCRLVLSWGKSKPTNKRPIAFQPDFNLKEYLKIPKPPKLYGNLGSYYIEFDKLSQDEAESFPSQLIDENQPLTTEKIDTLHVRSKLNRDRILSSAVY